MDINQPYDMGHFTINIQGCPKIGYVFKGAMGHMMYGVPGF